MSNERAPLRTKLLEEAKNLASRPGVYLMKNVDGVILYVGKAKSLKNRVTSYFQPVVHELGRIELMLQNVHHFDVILTQTENEALILECSLIKKHKPKYNVMLKDDKHFPYIRIQASAEFPKLEWVRRARNDGARYFGPFPSAYSARIVLNLLNESFRLRDCSDNTFSHRSRPCILFQMDKCSAPCVRKVNVEEYAEQMNYAIAVLEGKGKSLIEELVVEMSSASQEEHFEEAAKIRDQIQSIQLITETQSVSTPEKMKDRDVFAFARNESQAQGVVLQVRLGKLISVRHYTLQNTDSLISNQEIIFDFISQHFAEEKPINVLIREAPEELELLENTFNVSIKTPRSSTDKQLIRVAELNAQHALVEERKRVSSHGYEALEDVKKKLNLEKIPRRIECYDISNIQGEDAVASRVVFMEGAPEKELYRRYKIKTVIGANDFAMMREVLERRLTKPDEEKPDLIIVDGGKGQLAQAIAILNELNVQGIAVAGLAKARTESDFQAKAVRASSERIFLPNRVNPVVLLPHTKAFKLLTHLRDEAHRFAIQYHRKLRDNRSLGKS